MAIFAEVSKEEEKMEEQVEEEEEEEEEEEDHGAWCFLIINLAITNIFLLNMISVVTISVKWGGSYAHGHKID